MPYRRGRKSAAQTPAPRSERIKGSKKNPKGSAASKSSAYKIVLSEKTIKALSQKAKDYNKNHKNSVTLNTLKAVYRRGLGAYSSSHRPTITGGVPNTRNAWAMARVNKFLMKKSGKKVKAAYVQDDDLLAKGGNVFDDKELLKRYKKGKSIGFSAEAHLKAKGLIPRADGKKRKSEKYLADGGQVQELMRDGIVEIKMFDTTNEHSKEYGFDAQKPLFIQSIIVSKEHRGKGIGNKVFEYIVDNAKENKYDLIFGHIPQEAEPSIDFIKSMLNKSGFTTIEGNNDFYKIIDIKYEGGPNQIKIADGNNMTFDGNNPEGGFNDEVIICSNCLWSWKASESTPEEKYICHKCGHDNKPTMDKITMDVPLFIRLLEFAREDAKDDMELHTLTENALKMGDKTLTMEDYNEIVFSKITSPKITKSTNSLVEFPTIEQEFADGGVVVGKRHSESDENGTGEKFLVESTGQIVELEGGEGVLCKESMQSWHYYKFDGKEMTGRQIASYLNHKYGGVEFAKGGEVDEKSVCGCRSMYYHGGELPSATLDSLKGGEAVVTVKTMESKDKFQFQGRYMTPRKILSHINQESGGKKFEDGGIIDLTEHHLKNATNMVKMINFTEKIFYF
jgi:GNAT superfamily N-acetyltransferase